VGATLQFSRAKHLRDGHVVSGVGAGATLVVKTELSIRARDEHDAVTKGRVVQRRAGGEEGFVVGMSVNADERGSGCHLEETRRSQVG
jgi:hypothetical protein